MWNKKTSNINLLKPIWFNPLIKNNEQWNWPFQSLIHHMGLGIQCILLDFRKSLGNKAQMLVKSQLQSLQCLLTENITNISLLIAI